VGPTRANDWIKVTINLLYLAAYFLWLQAVVGIIGVTTSNTLRHNSWCTWRPRESSRNGDNTAIRHALSPLRPCGSVTVGVHGRPRGVAPSRHHTASRDTLVTAHGRRNDPSASHSSCCDARLPMLFSPPSCALTTTVSSSEAIDITAYERSHWSGRQ
jgi:hypothetical protein